MNLNTVTNIVNLVATSCGMQFHLGYFSDYTGNFEGANLNKVREYPVLCLELANGTFGDTYRTAGAWTFERVIKIAVKRDLMEEKELQLLESELADLVGTFTATLYASICQEREFAFQYSLSKFIFDINDTSDNILSATGLMTFVIASPEISYSPVDLYTAFQPIALEYTLPDE